MIDGSATNIQNPQSMQDLGYVRHNPQVESDKLSLLDDNLRRTLPIVTKSQVSEASTNNRDAMRDKDRFYEKRRMDLMSRKLKILNYEKERIKRAMSSGTLWKSAKSRTDSGINSEKLSSKAPTLNKKVVMTKLDKDLEKNNNSDVIDKKEEENDNIIPKEETKQFEQIIQPNYVSETKNENINNYKPEPIIETDDKEEEDNELENEIDNDDFDYNENREVEIKTTSSMRSKLKGLETKERVKLLMKRSMSSDKLSKARKNIADKALNEALDIPGVTEMTPEKQIKSDLSKLNLLNNPISKNIDEDVVSVHSRKSRNVSEAQSIASDSKISNYVRMLKTEIEKEKSAKDNALNILKGLKKKDKEVEKVINELSKN
eukprot:Mrub_01631.p1 GENE.Mrub_01631~~Mrub_01631.p1  ORF type:complete len:428 (+),score=148.63 Mrub_01631:162-1286(+)